MAFIFSTCKKEAGNILHQEEHAWKNLSIYAQILFKCAVMMIVVIIWEGSYHVQLVFPKGEMKNIYIFIIIKNSVCVVGEAIFFLIFNKPDGAVCGRWCYIIS